MKDWHFDIVLLHRLIEGWQNPDQLGACYVVPPIGSFMEHVTGCSMDRPGRIPGHWGASWQQDGTRKLRDGQEDRWLAGFTAKGPAQWLGAGPVRLPLAHDRLRWLTEPFPPPVGNERADDVGASAAVSSEVRVCTCSFAVVSRLVLGGFRS